MAYKHLNLVHPLIEIINKYIDYGILIMYHEMP